MAETGTMSLGLSHLFLTVFLFNLSHYMVVPAITDVCMAALCPGEDECSLAIYLTGVQQTVQSHHTCIIIVVLFLLVLNKKK
ncbi:hypothetical protein Hdeb2414_s0003g00083681 [Helianthus debilis subsp. tardiflorus]